MEEQPISTEVALDLLGADAEKLEVTPVPQMPNVESGTGAPADAHEDLVATMTKLRRRENHFVEIDRLFLSGGAKLALSLPVLAFILQLLSRRFEGGSPGWWLDSVEASLNYVTFSRVTALLAAVVIFAWWFTLVLRLALRQITRRIFISERDAFHLRGRPFVSLHGYESISHATKEALAHASGLMTLTFLTFLLQAAVALVGGQTAFGGVLVGLAIGGVLTGLGTDLLRRRENFNSNEPWGMLEAYNPPLHPAHPERVFTELLSTWMDPILASRFDEFVLSMRGSLQPGAALKDAVEHLVFLRHLESRGAIDDLHLRHEMTRFVREDRLDAMLDDDCFDADTWTHLYRHVRTKASPFFRLIERLQFDLRDDLESVRDADIHFDVDMENVVSDVANLFAFVHNNGDAARTIVLKVQTPDFQPHESEYVLALEPGATLSELGASPGDDALLTVLGEGGLVWQTLLPERDREATVTVRIEDPDGHLISGRVLTVQVRPAMWERIRRNAGVAALVAGFLSVAYRTIPWLIGLAAL